MDLTTMEGCYARELFINLPKIKAIWINKSSSLDNIKDFVKTVIEPAWINAAAKRRFIGYLEACTTKQGVYVLCQNAVKKAQNYEPTENKSKNYKTK